MAVRHKDISIRSDGNTGGLIERIRAISRYSFLADRHQYLASRTQLKDLVAPSHAIRILGGHSENRFICVRVTRPNVSLFINSKTMGNANIPLPKLAKVRLPDRIPKSAAQSGRRK